MAARTRFCFAWLPTISLRNFRNQVEDLAIMSRAEQSQVLRMRPQKRVCRTGRAAASQVRFWPVVFVPDLLGQQSHAVGEAFHRADKRSRVSASRQFVVPAFAGKQRPGSAAAPVHKGTAIRPLTVTVVIVTPPARALRRVDLEGLVHHAQAIDNKRVIRGENSVTRELQEPRIDDVASGIGGRRTRRLVDEAQHRRIDVAGTRRFARACRVQSHKVPGHAWDERSFCCNRPLFEMPPKEIRIAFDERCRRRHPFPRG